MEKPKERMRERMRERISKKGAIEVQFNWVMILVMGALILIIFFSVAQRQKNTSEQRISDKSLSQLNIVLAGSKVSADTANIITVPKNEIQFSCDSKTCTDYGCLSNFKIKGMNQAGKSYNVNPVFSPNSLKGEAVTLWALDWSIPYRISNLVYVTNPEARHIIVYNQGIQGSEEAAIELNKTLPESIYSVSGRRAFNIEMIELSKLKQIRNKNNLKSNFIVVNGANGVGDIDVSFLKSDVKVMNIELTSDEGIDGYGSVQFFELDKATKKYNSKIQMPFLGRASLFGAIFSEDSSNYECNMRKALNSGKIITDLTIDRINKLIPLSTPLCQSYYTAAKDILTNIDTSLSQFNLEGFSSLHNYRKELESINLNLQKQSCTTVY